VHNWHVERPAGGPDLAVRSTNDDNVILRIDDLVAVDSGVEVMRELADEVAEAVAAAVLATPRNELRLADLHVGVDDREDGGDIAAIERLVDSLDSLDALL
jgi:hypothetical protein